MGWHSFRKTITATLLAASLLLPSAAMAEWINHDSTRDGEWISYYQEVETTVTNKINQHRNSGSSPWYTTGTTYEGTDTDYSGRGTTQPGEFSMTMKGSSDWTAYCADFYEYGVGGEYTLISIADAATKYQKAAWLMDNYAPGIIGSGTDDAVTIAALQAAVWTLTTDQSSSTDTTEGHKHQSDWVSTGFWPWEGYYSSQWFYQYITTTDTGWFLGNYSPQDIQDLYNAMLADVDANFSLASIQGEYYFADGINNEGRDKQSLVVGRQVSGTPEPATMLLLGSGLAGLGAWRRRRRS